MLNITPDEETYLLTSSHVRAMLAKYNRAQAYQTADNTKRLQFLERYRALLAPIARRSI